MKLTKVYEEAPLPPLKNVLIELTPEEYRELLILYTGHYYCRSCQFVKRLQEAAK